MLETSARLLRLLSLLQTPRDWTGAELAARLAVDVRTVRRDIDKLRTLGYPVDATAGVAGYRLGAGAALPPLLLDDDEAIAVAIGLRSAAAGTVAGIEDSSLRALTKLEQVLPSRLRRQVGLLHSATVTLPAAGPAVDPDTLTAIAGAIRDSHRLRFDYRSHDDIASLRIVEPHRLAHNGRRWYLVAWDVDRADWRTFRVDRLRPRIPTGPRFVPRDPPADLAHYVSQGTTTDAYRYRATVTLLTTIEDAADRISPAAGLLEAVDEHSCLLHTGANSVEQLALYIGLLGCPFRIHEPPELAAAVEALAVRLLAALDSRTPFGQTHRE
ncbi:MAG: WYL domain-containing protein [Mycobacteriaceae bacterium]|nr:WYL domain-containing protein [Mycobacteriaceae bacterium]